MKEKIGAAVDRGYSSARTAVIFFALAMVFRGLGMLQQIGTVSGYSLLTELILPVVFCAMMIVCILFLGKRFLYLTEVPMVACLLFFIARSISSDNIFGVRPDEAESLIRITVYLVISVVYSSAVQTEWRLKWILVPAFALGVIYHFVFEDYPALFQSETGVSFSGTMMELAVIFILIAMMFLSFSFRPRGSVSEKQPDEQGYASQNVRHRGGGKTGNNGEKNLFHRFFSGLKKAKVNNEPAMEPAEQSSSEKYCPENMEEIPVNNTAEHGPVDMNTTEVQSSANHSVEKKACANSSSVDPPRTAEKAKPASSTVFDESFFDRPYRATLTLDPQPDSGQDTGNQ